MRFEWDEKKNAINIKKHGLGFQRAIQMFSRTPLLIEPDLREDYAEERWIGLGMAGAIVAVVVFVYRAPDLVRLISLREADKDEESNYYRQVFGS